MGSQSNLVSHSLFQHGDTTLQLGQSRAIWLVAEIDCVCLQSEVYEGEKDPSLIGLQHDFKYSKLLF